MYLIVTVQFVTKKGLFLLYHDVMTKQLLFVHLLYANNQFSRTFPQQKVLNRALWYKVLFSVLLPYWRKVGGKKKDVGIHVILKTDNSALDWFFYKDQNNQYHSLVGVVSLLAYV